jgi:hypothetical protein
VHAEGVEEENEMEMCSELAAPFLIASWDLPSTQTGSVTMCEFPKA